MRWILLLVLILPFAYAECVVPTNNMLINESIQLCTDIYNLTNGVRIADSDVSLDCNGATLNGSHAEDTIGVFAQEVGDIKIFNCKISGYRSAIYFTRVESSMVYDNYLSRNAYGLYLFETITSKFNENEIFNNFYDGIALNLATDNVLTKNSVYGNEHGIYSYTNSTDNQYRDNVVWNNTFGIFIVQGQQNYIKDNTVEKNKKNGIHLLGTNNEHVENNVVRGNEWSGIVIDRSKTIIFVDNVINDNKKTGIFIVNKSRDNIFTSNLLKNNWIYSVYLDDSAYNNSIFDNEIHDTDIKDITNASLNDYCQDGLMNKYYDDASGPGCLAAPVVKNETRNVTKNVTKNETPISFDPILISQKTIETVLQGARIDSIIEEIGLATSKLDMFKDLYEKTISSLRLKKRLSVIEVFMNGTRQNHTRISLIIEPNETMYNLSVYEKMPEDVEEEDIEFGNKNYTKINDYVYLWNFSVLDTPVNLSYVIKKLINGEPITFPLAQRVGIKKKIIIPETPQNDTPVQIPVPEQPATVNETVEPEKPDSQFIGIILMVIFAILVLVIVMVTFFKRSLKHTGLPHHDEDEIRQMVGYVTNQMTRGVTIANMRAYLVNLGYDREYIEEIMKRIRPPL